MESFFDTLEREDQRAGKVSLPDCSFYLKYNTPAAKMPKSCSP